MNISKFDFTKFDKEKWKQVIDFVEGGYNKIVYVTTGVDDIDGKKIPYADVEYLHGDDGKGCDEYMITFDAFCIKDFETGEFTRKWRKFMIKEFGEIYRYRLVNYLQHIREEKIKEADDEFYDAVLNLND